MSEITPNSKTLQENTQKKKYKFTFEKLAKIQSMTTLGQEMTRVQNEGAARLDALTHFFIWGSSTLALCHQRTTKFHNLPGKARGLGHRATIPWSITSIICPQQKEQSHIGRQGRKCGILLNVDQYCQINILNNHARNLKTHKVVLRST